MAPAASVYQYLNHEVLAIFWADRVVVGFFHLGDEAGSRPPPLHAAVLDHAAVSLLSRAAESLRMLDSATAADLAVRALQLATSDDPLRGPLAAQATQLLFAAGRSAEGLSLAQGAMRLLRPRLRAMLGYAVAQTGSPAESERILDDLEKQTAAVTDPVTRLTVDRARRTIAVMHDQLAGLVAGIRSGPGPSPSQSPWLDQVPGHRGALADALGPGAPRKITDEQVEVLITRTLMEKGRGPDSHWSTRTMAAEAGLSQSAVSPIWRAFGLKPHLVETWKLSTDPDFFAKVRDVVGLYMSPSERALVLAVDEKSQIQAYPGDNSGVRDSG
jgi:hypothetical protein